MKRAIFIIMLIFSALWLAGCTLVDEHYVRARPYAPPSVHVHPRPMPPHRAPVIRPWHGLPARENTAKMAVPRPHISGPRHHKGRAHW